MIPESLKNIVLRIVAVFTASALGVIGAGAIAGVELWKSALMAGIGGVATVIEALSRAFLRDGQLSAEELDEAFARIDG